MIVFRFLFFVEKEVDEYEERMKKFYEEEFPAIYDSRKDKYLNTIKECYNNGIYNIERFSAIKPIYDEVLNCKFIFFSHFFEKY